MPNPVKLPRMIGESLSFAFRSVVVNKLRTLLSLLGITIGIFAIISVFTVIDSLENNIRNSLSSFGENVIYVEKWPWAPEEGENYEWWQYLNRPVPTYDEYEMIRHRSQLARQVMFFSLTSKGIKWENNSIEETQIWGVSHEFEKLRNLEIEKGRFFSRFEFQSAKNLAVIGHTIATELFRDQDPLGQQIKVMGRNIHVIGVSEKEGKSLFGGGSLDEIVVVPIGFMRTLVDIRKENANPMIWVEAKPYVSNDELISELRMILRSARRLKPRADDNFALNQTSMISSGIDQIFSVFNLAGLFIGGFSILVGGFGIANIMFVSVRERTNIIGIQKALGAKRFFILIQFLSESILLAVTGGAIGLLLIFIGTAILGVTTNFSITLTAGNIVLGLATSSIIGLISGYAPAYSASRMNPVEAINTTF